VNEWRAYQAAWQKPIDEMTCTAEAFHHVRRHVLNLNRKQTARLLRVSVSSLINWETGVHPVPFPAYVALLLISESQHYRLASEAWRDWEFIERLPDDAFQTRKGGRDNYIHEFVNRRLGLAFTARDLEQHWLRVQEAPALKDEVAKLRAQVGELTAANTELRRILSGNGVGDELFAMRDRLQELVDKMHTGEVIAFGKAAA
jgi:DNA-binding transcriptional regulator YiaG